MNIAEPILKIGEMLRIILEDIREIKQKVARLEELANKQEERRINAEYNSIGMMGEYRG